MPVDLINGARVSWQLRGAGPSLLFCNGSGVTMADSELLISRLAERFTVLAWDYPGYGESELADEHYTMADLAAGAVALLSRARWPATRVCGISFGGMVAQELAVTHPERVQRLALLVTSPGGAGGSSYPLQELAALPAADRTATAMQLTDSRWTAGWLTGHRAERAIATFERRRLERSQAAGDDAALTAQLQARAGFDAWDRLPAITCPTWIGCGRYDGLAPAANSAALASRIPGAELHTYEGGHLLLFQDPRAERDVIAFLSA